MVVLDANTMGHSYDCTYLGGGLLNVTTVPKFTVLDYSAKVERFNMTSNKQYIIARTIIWSTGCVFVAVASALQDDIPQRMGGLVLAALSVGFIWQGVYWYKGTSNK